MNKVASSIVLAILLPLVYIADDKPAYSLSAGDSARARADGITLWDADTPVAIEPGDQGLQLAIASDGAGGAVIVWDVGEARMEDIRYECLD
jgi:hypothetical protein